MQDPSIPLHDPPSKHRTHLQTWGPPYKSRTPSTILCTIQYPHIAPMTLHPPTGPQRDPRWPRPPHRSPPHPRAHTPAWGRTGSSSLCTSGSGAVSQCPSRGHPSPPYGAADPNPSVGGGGGSSSATPLLISRSCIGRETRVIHGALRFPFETPRNHIMRWGH